MTDWLDFINRADGSWATWGLIALAVVVLAVMLRFWSTKNRRAARQRLRDEEHSRLRDI